MSYIIIGVEATNKNVYTFIGYVTEISEGYYAFIGIQTSGDCSERSCFFGLSFDLINVNNIDMSVFIGVEITNKHNEVFIALEGEKDGASCYTGLYANGEIISYFFGIINIIKIN